MLIKSRYIILGMLRMCEMPTDKFKLQRKEKHYEDFKLPSPQPPTHTVLWINCEITRIGIHTKLNYYIIWKCNNNTQPKNSKKRLYLVDLHWDNYIWILKKRDIKHKRNENKTMKNTYPVRLLSSWAKDNAATFSSWLLTTATALLLLEVTIAVTVGL